jgi:hypothetical protein
MADELEPLLRTAETLRTMPKPVLAPEAKARIEDQVLAAVAGNPRLVAAPRPRPRFALPRWRVPRWAINALTLVLALIVAMTAVVGASADALPDSALYPFKRISENVWLWVAPARSESRIHLELARRRLAEIEAMAAKDKFEADVLEALDQEVEATLAAAEALPPALALPVLDEVSAFAETQRQTLADVIEVAPPEAQVYLENALFQSLGIIERVESLRSSLRPGGTAVSPVPVSTATPTSTPAPVGAEEETATSTPTPTATSIMALGITATPTWTPSPGPTSTATLAPTSEPRAPEATNTPPPPPPPTEPPPPPPPTEPPPPPPPPPPTDTPSPPEPTEKVPPGLTKTPQPPGQTKTPQPGGDSKP